MSADTGDTGIGWTRLEAKMYAGTVLVAEFTEGGEDVDCIHSVWTGLKFV